MEHWQYQYQGMASELLTDMKKKYKNLAEKQENVNHPWTASPQSRH